MLNIADPLYQTKRQVMEILRAQLDTERSSFIPHYRDIADHVRPRRARFTLAEANRGERRSQKIINAAATLASRTGRAGMMSGVTSPARPWFKLAAGDPKSANIGRVKKYLYDVQQIMTTSFLKSNLYNTLPIVYGDLLDFGTAPMLVEEDFTGEVFTTESFPVGSYMISKNEKGKVDTFVRDFKMTVRQLIAKFAKRDGSGNIIWDNFSTTVKSRYDQKQFETWIDVCHVIMPNSEYDNTKLDSKYKRYTSCYYERGSSTQAYSGPQSELMLRESGYDIFPVLCPRWETTAEDVYGTDCPGMTALGDIRQLQLGEKRSWEAVDKMIRPPMVGPTSMRGHAASILPGDVTYADTREGMQGFRPAFQFDFRIDMLEGKIQQIISRIQRAYFEDLFLMLSQSDRREITAREIDERHEEKLLALGPVLEQLNQDLLDPLIDLTFDIHVRQGLLPEPPEELQGVNLKIEYVSIMAQAQKLLGISSVERFIGFVGQVAAFDGSVLDKVVIDEAVNIYGDMTSVPPALIRPDEEANAMRQARAQQQQQAMQAEQMVNAAGAAKDLSQASLEGDNALNALLGK